MTSHPNLEQLISNRYRLVEAIGQGAMGSVYRGKDIVLGNTIAVKFLAQHLVNQQACERFENEAKVCAQLGQKSHHIVRVMDYGTDDREVPFFVMEYLPGESLRTLVKSKPLSLPRFLRLAQQICLGLQCAHQGIAIPTTLEKPITKTLPRPIIHRDIKPSNILVNPDPTWSELAKILDFGISTMLQGDTHTTSYMGTPAYSAPEQLEGATPNPRFDIYSLGVTLFEMLTSQLPLKAESPLPASWYHAHRFQFPRHIQEVASSQNLPKALQALVMGCLEKSPKNRPQTIAEILHELNPLVEQHPVDSRSVAIAVRPTSPISSQPEVVDSIPVYPKRQEYSKSAFAQPLVTAQETLPALWVMLPHEEIQTIQINKLYNQIHQKPLCVMSPHPMVLWATAISNPKQEKRWFKFFLDLKSVAGQKMTRLLVEKQMYAVLFFDLEEPHCCSHRVDIKLNLDHCSKLQYWAIAAQSARSIGLPEMSKKLLRQEFDR